MFYVIDRENKVRTSGHLTEIEAMRDSLRTIGGLSYNSIQAMDGKRVEQMFRSMGSAGCRTILSRQVQRMGQPYKQAPRA
jgi:hypothetical protein